MKCVTKGASPRSFEVWKATANASWQPSYNQLANPEKRDVHHAALRSEVIGRALDPEFLTSLSEAELLRFRDACKRRDRNGRLLAFGHVIARYAEQFLPDDEDDPDIEARQQAEA